MKPMVGVIMGSKNDWPKMEPACSLLKALKIPYEKKVVSAHRTPRLMYKYARSAKKRGIRVIITGAGGAAALPGMTAAMTPLPVIGVPVMSSFNNGLDSLLSIAQMPGGIPVGTVGANSGGALNAAMLTARILALLDPKLAKRLDVYITAETQDVLDNPNPKKAYKAAQAKKAV